MDQDFRIPVQAELIRTLYGRVPNTHISFIVISTVFVALMWNGTQHRNLVLWLIALYLGIVGRLVLSWAFVRRKPNDEAMSIWGVMAAFFSLYQGLVWGATAPLFIPSGDIVSFVTVTAVLLGLANASGIVLAPYLPSLVLFVFPVMGLFISVLLMQGGELAWSVTVFALLTLVSMTNHARVIHRSLSDSLHLQFENAELRRKEEERAQLLESMVKELKLREQALDRARRVAEQANMAKTRFLAAASHDLRQPMHALGLSFTTLAEKVTASDVAPLVTQIEKAIEAINSMLNALLDISKLDADVVIPNKGAVSMHELLSSLNSEYQAFAKQSGNRLQIRDSHAWVESDTSMLQRILRNLLSNALRYTTKGRVLVATRRRGNKLRIEVHDTGIGIPEDRFDDIFVEFQQLGNPQRDRSQGLGLGLAIVKRLAMLLGHSIELRSKPGHGSCFTVSVPLLQKQPPVTDTRSKTRQMLGNELLGCCVLLLDDDIAVRESMQSLLEHWGCSVYLAASIEQAESLSRSHTPDILIADYRLPGSLTGLDAVVHLRNYLGNELQALIITGDTAPQRLREAQDSGLPLLHKPVQPAKLRSTMRKMIQAVVKPV